MTTNIDCLVCWEPIRLCTPRTEWHQCEQCHKFTDWQCCFKNRLRSNRCPNCRNDLSQINPMELVAHLRNAQGDYTWPENVDSDIKDYVSMIEVLWETQKDFKHDIEQFFEDRQNKESNFLDINANFSVGPYCVRIESNLQDLDPMRIEDILSSVVISIDYAELNDVLLNNIIQESKVQSLVRFRPTIDNT